MLNVKDHWLCLIMGWSTKLVVCLAIGLPPLAAAQSIDETALRTLTDKFFVTYQKEDVNGLRLLWSVKSPELVTFTQQAQATFAASEKIEVKSISVRRVAIDGAKATVRVAVEMSAMDAKTGQPAEVFGKLNRTLRFVREDEGWKVWQYVASEEELASALVAAQTEGERHTLLTAEKELQTVELRKALIKQGERLQQQGEGLQSLTVYRLAQSLAEKSGDTEGLSIALRNVGNIQRMKGDNIQASEYYHQSLKLSEKLGDKTGAARTLHNIGLLYAEQGSIEQALEYYHKSLALREALGDKAGIVSTLNNIGTVSVDRRELSESLEHFQRVLVLREAVGDKRGIAATIGNIGEIYRLQGNYDQALEYLQKARTQFEMLGDKDFTAVSLSAIAKIYLLKGDYAQAAEFAERSVALATQSGRFEAFAGARNTAGNAYFALGQYEKARQAFVDVISKTESLRHQVAGDELARQRFFAIRLTPYYGMIALSIDRNQPGEALAYAERAKARALLDIMLSGRVKITKVMTAQEQEQEQRLENDLVSLNRQLSREKLLPQPDVARLSDLNARIAQARLKFEDFRTRLYAAHPELKVQRGEAPPVSLEEAGALLPGTKSALLEFVVTDDKSFLFVLTTRVLPIE